MPIPLSINVYQRGVAGVPSASVWYGDVAPRATSYEHTISDQFGFESMQVTMPVTLDEAIDWLSNGLMRSVIVSGPDAEIVWEGYLNTVSFDVGGKSAKLSLDGMANRVRCTYTTVLGTPGVTNTSNDTFSQALYGIKDRVVPLDNSTSTEAGYRAAVVLADLASPKSREASQAVTGSAGDITLTLSFVGWYGTLEWLVTSNNTTSTATTTTQVGTLLTNYTAVNNFMSSATYYITSSGISSTQYIEAQTTYREAIEARLKLGTGSYPLAWGIYEDTIFRVETWAGFTPEVFAYYERLGDSNIYTTNGGIIPPWDVRPNKMAVIAELMDVVQAATSPDAVGRKYVGRVTCTISGNQIGCTLEPSELDSIETRLAAMR